MTDFKKFLNIKYKLKDQINYEKSLFLNSLYSNTNKKQKLSFLPHAWHWIFFNQNTSPRDLGLDGHVKRGLEIPKLKGYKRMFVGADLFFNKRIKFGSCLERTSYIEKIIKKKKNKDNLYFLKKKNIYKLNNITYLEENQHLVFLKNNYISKSEHVLCKKGIKKTIFKKKFNLNNVVLFKFSALTFNSHRIHYDIDYAKKNEGYKGLLVHGPLLAIIVLDYLDKLKFKVKSFSFRILSPIYVNQDFYLKIFATDEKKKYKACLYKKNLQNISFYCDVFTFNK